MKEITIREIKKGEFFRLTASESAPVWVKGYYVAAEKKYEAYKYEDTNRETFLKGNRRVFVEFTF